MQRGRIGAIAPRVIGMPTHRSQRHTLDVDAPEVLALCQADAVDAALRARLRAFVDVTIPKMVPVGLALEAALETTPSIATPSP